MKIKFDIETLISIVVMAALGIFLQFKNGTKGILDFIFIIQILLTAAGVAFALGLVFYRSTRQKFLFVFTPLLALISCVFMYFFDPIGFKFAFWGGLLFGTVIFLATTVTFLFGKKS